MKHFKVFAVLLAVLAIASIGYAERNSSPAAQTQPVPYAANSGWGWGCPMWGSGPGGGNRAQAPVGPYGPMGPGMMYYYGSAGSAQNQPAAPNSGSNARQTPENGPQASSGAKK